ncbi:cinnamoyl-CoA reductase CAD2-like isoform X1 [Prosopis cineraria]|uniref:cinnamoyl-CoA reductase CAD2-like isoform X1 n=1 Tax=Prosopis cineraria TaxID=364024 RepID=UPI00240EBA65|nr:cinnamoyl-CoA reductase CAD2-like isoform X1 [Prosopis cineraria]
MSNNAGKVVCVTGASGYIASWLVKLLLLRGYTVKATVRDINDPKKLDHLLELEGAKERLQLCKANLLEEGSFDSAVEGCEGVFHTASPCIFNVKDPQIELIDPAVKGTLNILKSCAKSPSLKRVILTSSMAAVLYNGKPITPDVVVDETWFSKADFCKESELWSSYELSKTLAEDAAWKFVRENNIDMVVINPGVVLGPLLQPSLNQTSATILTLINGEQMLLNPCVGWIHVKDVANAHIQAFDISSASGRYCLVERVAHFSDIVKITQEIFPTLPLPEKFVEDESLVPQFQVSKEKAMTLGIEFIPLDVAVKETVESLKEKKFLNL